MEQDFYRDVVLFLQLNGFEDLRFDALEKKFIVRNLYLTPTELIELANRKREKLNLHTYDIVNARNVVNLFQKY